MLERVLYPWTKDEIFDYTLRSERYIEKHLYHVTLLTIVILITIAIDYQSLTTGHINLNEVELPRVDRIGQYVVPGHTLNRLLGQLPIIQALLDIGRDEIEAVVLPHVFVFEDHPVSVGQLHSLEEVG